MLHDILVHDHSDTRLWSDIILTRDIFTELDLITDLWPFY